MTMLFVTKYILVYVLNYSWVFGGIWQMLKRALPESARARVSFPSSTDELWEHFDREDLSTGKLFIIHTSKEKKDEMFFDVVTIIDHWPKFQTHECSAAEWPIHVVTGHNNHDVFIIS